MEAFLPEATRHGHQNPSIQSSSALCLSTTNEAKTKKKTRAEKEELAKLTLHLALVVDDHSAVVLKVDEHAVLPPPGLALPHHHGGHHCTVTRDKTAV